MPEVFADTGGWANAFVRTEPHHALAAMLLRKWRQDRTRVVTSSYVLSELVALFTSPIRLPRSRAVAIVDSLLTAPWIEVVYVDRALHEEGWNLLKSRLDKRWSLVDCTSFVLMERRGIIEALTPDHHFEQAGFVRLLK
jgi:predicted nucleic acid-binding protein